MDRLMRDRVSDTLPGADESRQRHVVEETSSVTVSRGRAAFVHVTLVLFAAAIIARLVQVQLVEREAWQRTAVRQQVRDLTVEPIRGAILDATGNVLVETREQMKLVIEPQNLVYTRKGKDGRQRTVDNRSLVRRLLRDLRVSESDVRRVFNNPKARWVELPDRFLPADLERLKTITGVRIIPVLTRVNATSDGLRGVVGVVGRDGVPVGGLELELDTYLRGKAGHTPMVLDGRGGRIASPLLAPVAARPGHTVTLTINQSLQEIAELALADARRETGASGGDVVILDPRDGSVLALAAVRDGRASRTSTPLTDAYEPGSVMKPFLVSRLLDAGLAVPDEFVDTENGNWSIAGRTLRDEHKAVRMSVRDVIRYSSNIGTAKLALRFSEREEYQALRDFGFGTYTGVAYPAESRGRLALPQNWGRMTPASVAIGYEMMATPLQIAAAYAAIANDGELLEPVLVREVRDSEGQLVFAHRKRSVRRVVSPATAALMRAMLKSVVDSGTARSATLTTFDVAGKSGTARRMVAGRGYVSGRYNASFAGIFPAEDPQYVIVARLIDPVGTYFGGVVSGAMANRILQDALATRDASLDRDALAKVSRTPRLPASDRPVDVSLSTPARDTSHGGVTVEAALPEAEPQPGPDRIVVDLPHGSQGFNGASRVRVGEALPVPYIKGLNVRQAVRMISAAGLRVSLVPGSELRTTPMAGTLLKEGATVRLEVPAMVVSSGRRSRTSDTPH